MLGGRASDARSSRVCKWPSRGHQSSDLRTVLIEAGAQDLPNVLARHLATIVN